MEKGSVTKRSAPWREKKNLKEQWQRGESDGTRRERALA